MALEIQITPDALLLIQLLQLYYVVATIGIATAGWITYLAPDLSTELSNFVLFGKLRLKQRSRLQRLLEVPKRWFTHFYVVATICSTTAALAIFGYLKDKDVWNDDWQSDRVRLAIALFTLHTYRRLYECLFISVFSESKMNLLHYIFGMTFYICVPASIVMSGSYSQHPWRVQDFDPFNINQYDALTVGVFLGVVMYLWAFVHQHRSFKILAHLRHGRSNTTHSIPYGDLFRFVSTPHYFCECVLYAALWLIIGLQCRLWVWILALVFTNQLLCALQTHRWYGNTFGNKYPSERRALVPFIL